MMKLLVLVACLLSAAAAATTSTAAVKPPPSDAPTSRCMGTYALNELNSGVVYVDAMLQPVVCGESGCPKETGVPPRLTISRQLETKKKEKSEDVICCANKQDCPSEAEDLLPYTLNMNAYRKPSASSPLPPANHVTITYGAVKILFHNSDDDEQVHCASGNLTAQAAVAPAFEDSTVADSWNTIGSMNGSRVWCNMPDNDAPLNLEQPIKEDIILQPSDVSVWQAVTYDVPVTINCPIGCVGQCQMDWICRDRHDNRLMATLTQMNALQLTVQQNFHGCECMIHYTPGVQVPNYRTYVMFVPNRQITVTLTSTPAVDNGVIRVKENDPGITLSCDSVEGQSQAAKYEWKKDGRTLTLDSRVWPFLAPMQPFDAGVYSCSVQTGDGTGAAHVKIEVASAADQQNVAIVLSSIAAAVVLIIIILVVVVLVRRRREKYADNDTNNNDGNEEGQPFEDSGALKSLSKAEEAKAGPSGKQPGGDDKPESSRSRRPLVVPVDEAKDYAFPKKAKPRANLPRDVKDLDKKNPDESKGLMQADSDKAPKEAKPGPPKPAPKPRTRSELKSEDIETSPAARRAAASVKEELNTLFANPESTAKAPTFV